MELDLLLEREPWPTALAWLKDWGALALVDGALQGDDLARRRLAWARRFGLPLLPAWLAAAADPAAVAERLQLRRTPDIWFEAGAEVDPGKVKSLLRRIQRGRPRDLS
jgi:poly(A) polymerase